MSRILKDSDTWERKMSYPNEEEGIEILNSSKKRLSGSSSWYPSSSREHILCFLISVKRCQEPKEERRPWRIWFYDTSKQAIGSLFIHFTNVFLSNLTEEDPCTLYLMNFLLDATLGMLVIWLSVKIVSSIVEHRQYTLLMFGEYGDPPQAAAWLGQCVLYLLIMVIEKTIISLVLLIPGWTKLQEILLDYIPDPQLELVLVMLVVPFIVNAIMFWVVDSLIMKKYKKLNNYVLESDSAANGSPAAKDEESQALLGPRV
ncbi:store-operated calcium entry regulator STIMATE-like [Ascaphus truei]|uniref:store-operated calcium entry regulator STIMATE-like n=1 Tax=Ascaphus truei TaxID=8439 RepID=UPI003F5A5BDD